MAHYLRKIGNARLKHIDGEIRGSKCRLDGPQVFERQMLDDYRAAHDWHPIAPSTLVQDLAAILQCNICGRAPGAAAFGQRL